jgi:hypothetical protein
MVEAVTSLNRLGREVPVPAKDVTDSMAEAKSNSRGMWEYLRNGNSPRMKSLSQRLSEMA